MTWPYARPKPPMLALGVNYRYQQEHPQVVTIRKGFVSVPDSRPPAPRVVRWVVENNGRPVAKVHSYARAAEFVRDQLARRESTSA